MSNLRLPFDEGDDRAGVARGGARPGGARVRRGSPRQRRAGGLGRHRQDARAGRSLREPAARRRGPAAHPGHDLHAQGRRRDARPHPDRDDRRRRRAGISRRRGGASCATAWATSRSAPSTRSACRCCASIPLEADLDPGFSVADDAEVPRLIGEVARPRPAHLPRAGARTTRTSGWCSRSWGTVACGWAWPACWSGGWWRRPRWADPSPQGSPYVDGADGGRPRRRVAGAR